MHILTNQMGLKVWKTQYQKNSPAEDDSVRKTTTFCHCYKNPARVLVNYSDDNQNKLTSRQT